MFFSSPEKIPLVNQLQSISRKRDSQRLLLIENLKTFFTDDIVKILKEEANKDNIYSTTILLKKSVNDSYNSGVWSLPYSTDSTVAYCLDNFIKTCCTNKNIFLDINDRKVFLEHAMKYLSDEGCTVNIDKHGECNENYYDRIFVSWANSEEKNLS